MPKPRKNYTPSEKVAVLKRHLLEKVPVSDLWEKQRRQAPRMRVSGAAIDGPGSGRLKQDPGHAKDSHAL